MTAQVTMPNNDRSTEARQHQREQHGGQEEGREEGEGEEREEGGSQARRNRYNMKEVFLANAVCWSRCLVALYGEHQRLSRLSPAEADLSLLTTCARICIYNDQRF